MAPLLWISPFLPWPLRFGGTIRVYHLLRRAAACHRVTLACLLQPGESEPEVPASFADMLEEVRFFPRREGYRRAQLRSLVTGRCHHRTANDSPALDAWIAAQGERFAAIVVEFTQMAWARPPRGARLVLDLHNIEHELLARTAEGDPARWRRWWRRRDARALARDERGACARFDLVAVPSEREAHVLAGWGLRGRIEPIPNGVDVAGFERPLDADEEAAAADCPEIAYIGTMQYYPNEEAVLHFAAEAWPRILAARPETTFGVIGGRPKASVSRLASANFRILGMVPEIRPYFHRARLLAVPLRSGGGTRLKILEAAASGTPLVTTSIGCEGIDLVHGVHALVADDPASFAASCLDVLRDPQAARRRAEAARELVRSRYDWDPIGRRFSDLISEIAGTAAGIGGGRP